MSLPVALVGIFLALSPTLALAAVPDFTATGVIAALKASPSYSSSPYNETFNLGATGLRGWIYDGGGQANSAVLGLQTDLSRQILITVASTPGSAVLAVDDVILGAMAGSTGTVPLFTSDSRKAIGMAISNAEKTGAGTLRVKRWRAGTTTDVNIAMTIMGDYTATAPYNCPKSTQVLAAARTKLVAELIADPNYLTSGFRYASAVKGLALMAGVVPGDANYATVQSRLQSYAQGLTPANLTLNGCDTWNWAYENIFLSEYYLRSVEAGSPDAGVLAGINKYTVAMAKGQSRYGTFGHGGSALKADGSLHGTIPPYGPVNCAGVAANLSIVFGKKALLAGSQALDPEIDPAIERGSNFFKYYVNKGTIPYGEHEPAVDAHSFNGKEPMCALFYALQGNRPVETEYFSRIATAGYMGREEGHTGTGFNYLWEAMGANVGGPTAVAKYLEKIRWNLDLERRTDGSFVYDGAQRTAGGGSTGDGTYLGYSDWQTMNPTASYVLTYSLPLQRLYITGKNANPANTLNAAKVDNAIAAATYQLDCPAYSNTQLIADLSQFDPVVRDAAAIELGKRTLTTGETNTLIAMVDSTNANERMGACQAVGILQIPAALPLLSQRLSDPDLWVRAKAAKGLRSFSPTASSSQLTPMLNAFIANATDPEVIVWDDPIQIANNFLSFALFGDSVYNGNNIASYTLNAPKNLLYPAVRAGLRQPDSNPRLGVSSFTYNLTLADAQALTPELFTAATTPSLADTMWHGEARAAAISALANFKAAEAIPLAVDMQQVVPDFAWGADNHQIGALNALSTFGDAARWTLPGLRAQALTLDTGSSTFATITNAIASIEAAITSPAGINNLMAVANPQVVVTGGAKAITLTGSSCRGTAVTFYDVTAPAHGTLTGTAPNLIYTPTANYIGPDFFTFKASDTLTTSASSTVSIIVGVPGTGLKGEYFDNSNFTNLKVTRTDPEVNFDWGTGSPDPLVGADTFSARWSGQLLIPETGNYTFSTLNSDGTRLYINGVLILDDYVDQLTGWKDGTPISLTAGQRVELQMEYYENTGSAVAKLKWTGPSLGGLNGLPIAKEWLYDGTGIATRTAYAHAQSVTLIQNAPQAITLTGSGATQTSLTYSIVTPPGHGTLNGTAPNLTYTPASNYSGSDSFSFTVNNGTGDSAPATVSIGIWAGLPSSYFWTNAVAGNWSGAFWTNAAGGSVTPATAGNSTYSLNFNQSGTYTTTQNLNNNYLFNLLNVAGTVTFAGTNSLSPTANGSILPQVNQNSGNSVTFSAPLNLAAMTSFGGTGGGSLTISSLISGTGGLTKDSPGSLNITNISNTFSGGTVISKGTLYLDLQRNQGLGTGPITLNPNGTLLLNRIDATNALIFNGGTIYAENGWGNSFSGLVTLNTTSTMAGPYALTLSGAISGAGGINKTGNGTLVLSGSNTFTGANSISAGTLQCNSAAALGSGAINITSGAKVSLNFTGTRVIAALSYNGGAPLPPGTYGSTTSPATNQDNTYFLGNGTITILPASTTSLNLTAGSNPSILGTTLTFTATVTGTAPTGNVAFYDGTTLLGTNALNGSFQASFTTSSLAVGTHNITAKYAGNASHAASMSAVLGIGINSSVPAVPSQLTATSLVNWVGLTWSASNGATSYQVKRSITSGGPYMTIGTVSGTSYTDTAIVNGTTYEYVVSAVTGTGTSANSAAVSAMPIIPSSAKDILTFVFPGLPAANISGTNISMTVPSGTNLASLAPTYTLSVAASGVPISGTARDFNTPQSYTITAEDGSTKIYNVTVSLNVAPVAASQNVTATEDIATPITLAATDANGDVLSYAVVTQPANGTLSGTPPNLTYTPAANFSGADSFTFKANDGLLDSAAATVNLTVTGVNDPPVAAAQSVTLGVNLAKPITLSATDVEGSALTYVIVTQPTNGTLSGTAPAVTYTPFSNYLGADSFTFKVNDGAIDSAEVTVSLTVTSLVYTWNSAIAGNWSDSTKWSGTTGSPISNGFASYVLNFNAVGTYIATHNLSAGFLLNRINFGGSTATLAGNSLALAINGSILPQVNQNSANTATISTNMALTANTTLGGTGGGALTLSGIVSGGGSLSKTTTGNLTLSSANTYTGGTAVSSGTLTLANQSGLGTGSLTLAAGTTFQQSTFEGNSSAGALPNALVLSGTGNVTMNMPFGWKDVWLGQPVSGTGGFSVLGGNRSFTLTANNTFSGGVTLKNYDNRIQISHLNALGTGIFRSERLTANSGQLVPLANLSAGSGVANAFDIASGAYLNVFADGSNHLLLSGPITSVVGMGNLYKSGTATLTLAGTNTYTGTTTVAAGTLACNNATALGQGPVVITSGKLNLIFTGTRQVASMTLSGVVQPNGSYGSTASPATNKNDTYFSGVGTVTVGPLNSAPVASAQSVSTAEDTATAITLTASDVDLDALTYAIVSLPTSGTLSGTAPNVTYTPAANYNGADSFTFTANDGTVDSAAATVTITVTAANDAPVAAAQSVSTAEDTAKAITLGGSDVDLNALTYSVVIPPANGTLSGTAPNVTYTPTANYNGADSFTFKANDGTVDSAAATVTITVTPVNDAPVASAQSVSTAEDTAKAITLAGSDVDLNALTYSVVTPPANGTLSGTAPNVTYTPAANYNGPDSFTFRTNDGTMDSAAANVTITVTAVNDAPVASAQSVTTAEGVALPITLAGTDVEASALTYAIITPPANGTLSGTAPNVIYTPTGSYNGADSFTFKANDGNLDSVAATVSIAVTSATFTWNSGIAGNWSDGTKWTPGSSPGNNGLSNYILNFNALGTFTATNDLSSGFLLNRINFGGSTATLAGNGLALVVNGATLPQVNQNSANPATVSANLALNANTTLGGSGAGALTLSGIISGSSSLTKTTTGSLTLAGLNTYSGGTTVSSGTLTLANQNGLGTGTLTLAAGTTFQQSGFEGNSSAGALPNAFVLNGNVTLNIPFSWKDVWLSQPVSGSGGFTVQGGNRSLTLTGNNTFSGGVILKDYDNRIQISHLNALGTGTFRTERTTAGSEGKLIPLANLSTGLGVANAVDIAANAYFNVFADGTNHLLLSGPITSAVGSGHLYKTGIAKLTLSGANTYTGSTTVAAGTLDCTYATSLGNGSVSIASGAKLGLNFSGTRQIASLSLDGVTQPNGSYGSTASSAINKNDAYFSGSGTVTVGPLNTAPVASAQSVSTAEDTARSILLTATDVDGNPLTYSIVDAPTSGTLSGTAPNLTYTPPANYSGVDSFTFKANDGTLDSNVATVTITVTPVNDAPAAFAQSVSTAEDTAKAITLTASDLDSGSVTYSIVTAPANGTLSGTAPNLTYTPAANYNGADSFTFKANDGSLDSAAATVTITVTPVNDAPVASAQSVTTAEDTAKSIILSATDVDGGALTYAIVSSPAHGALSGTAPNLTYTPVANYNGADSFTFKANDGLLDSVAATVTITLTSVNDAPVFTVNPIVAIDGVEGTAYTGQTLNGRATDADTGDTITYTKVSGPAWLAVATDGTLSGTPTLGSAGLNSFVVRATDSASATADAGLQITVTALPLPWLTGDVGTGMLAGSATYSAGTFTQAGSGTLGTTSDKLRFTYQTLTGDGEIIAKISALQNTGTASRVGVMIRDTLATNSMEIFMGMTGTNAYRWVRRTTTGGTATTSNSSTGTVPNTWVRLVRSGTTITAYKGTNGTTWTTVGSTTVTMATNCYIGLAVTSGSDTTLNTSQFSNLSVTP